MRQWCRHISFRRVTRFGHAVVTCALVSVLFASSVTTQAILIHDHHGHETHVHTLTVQDLGEWRENSEHQHAEHEHDDRPADPSEDKDPFIVIVLNLPVALPGGQGVPASVVVSNAAPATTILSIDTAASYGRPCTGSQTSCVCLWHARSLVADILLAGHALLL